MPALSSKANETWVKVQRSLLPLLPPSHFMVFLFRCRQCVLSWVCPGFAIYCGHATDHLLVPIVWAIANHHIIDWDMFLWSVTRNCSTSFYFSYLVLLINFLLHSHYAEIQSNNNFCENYLQSLGCVEILVNGIEAICTVIWLSTLPSVGSVSWLTAIHLNRRCS